jgi:hypothetical protein
MICAETRPRAPPNGGMTKICDEKRTPFPTGTVFFYVE